MNKVHGLSARAGMPARRSALVGWGLVAIAGLAAPMRPCVAAERQAPYVKAVGEVLAWEVPEPSAERSPPDRSATQRDAILESDAMLEAIVWLDQYFAVQRDYTPEEVEAFKARLRTLTPVQLRTFLAKFQQERAQRRAHHDATKQRREQALMFSRAAAQRSDLQPRQEPAGFERAPYGAPMISGPRFDRYRPYPPLINSRTVARLTVFRVLFD